MSSIPRMAMVLCGIFTFLLFGANAVPGSMVPALAQSAQPQRFAIAIKDRKVEAASSLLHVNQGDAVELVLTSDEAAEIHLHGYDKLISLTPNVSGTIRFTAKIAGRFPLEAHGFGTGASSGRQRGHGPLLYIEVHPR
jgi:hypothetical protein